MAKGGMKVKVVDIENLAPEELEEELNDALKELADYYVEDIMELNAKGNSVLAILYFSKKKKE